MAALLCAALGSLLPAWARVPIPLYEPVERTWRIAPMASAGASRIEISFYGVYVCALVVGLVGAGLGLAVERRWPVRSADAVSLLPMWALCAVLLAAAYQIFTLFT
jgi:hypothetical protein